MSYQGKFEGNAARNLHIIGTAHPTKKISKRQKLIDKRKKLLKAAVKALGKRILLAIGLLLSYVAVYGMMLGMMLMLVRPDSVWPYLICGISAGYSFLVLNCRAFEYIGDRMGPNW